MPSLKKIVLAAVSCLFISGCSTGEDGPREVVYYDADIAMTYPEMAREMSNGSVQIYGLDDPVTPSALYSPVYQDGGVPSSVDPNVTVYPFDDGGSVQQSQTQAQRPTLVPPSEKFRPLESPFGGPIQTPMQMPERSSSSSYVPVVAPLELLQPLQSPGAAMSRIYYSHGSSSLNTTGEQVANFIGSKGGKISVEGHASQRAEIHDPVERSIVNLKMSMDRAFKVSSKLIRSGVPAGSIETKAYGATRPAAALAGVDQEAASRRVEIYTALNPQPPVSVTNIYAPPPHSVMPVPLDAPVAPVPPLARYY